MRDSTNVQSHSCPHKTLPLPAAPCPTQDPVPRFQSEEKSIAEAEAPSRPSSTAGRYKTVHLNALLSSPAPYAKSLPLSCLTRMKFATATLAVLAAAGTVSADNWLDQLGNSFKNKGQEIAACAKASSQLSCNAKYDIPASSSANCCFNGALVDGGKQSGLILSTSFWTTTAADPANNGPKDSTTIHGLWPDCECLIRCRKQTSTCILTITLRSREYGPFFFFSFFFGSYTNHHLSSLGSYTTHLRLLQTAMRHTLLFVVLSAVSRSTRAPRSSM